MTRTTTSLFGPLAAEAAALVEGLRKSVVHVADSRGHGSGVIWSSDGRIVTNHHVVARDRAKVELIDGPELAATVVARDPENDLALLQVAANDLPAAPIGDSTALRVGHLIVAVGNPFGVRGTATLGIVSANGNASWMGDGRRDVLQADVELAPGSSGGLLADSAGRVVGIASMILSPGIAIAVPSRVVERFVAARPSARPYLGVTIRPVPLPKAVAASMNGGLRGLLLVEVEDNSLAESAGLLPGDLLLRLDGKPIHRPTDLTDRLSRSGEDTLRLTLLRGGTLRHYDVDLTRGAA